MGKAVLISINPKWCEKIANGLKTIEIRKTRPNAILPLKCYIYCTKPKFEYEDLIILDNGNGFYGGGKVVGEFVLHEIYPFSVPFPAYQNEVDKETLDDACLTYGEAHNYLGHKSGYAWRISDPVFYDTPKELCAYTNLAFRKSWEEYEKCEARFGEFMNVVPPDPRDYSLSRPPQSWCYVEQLEECNDGHLQKED